jgi:hypothetical protein
MCLSIYLNHCLTCLPLNVSLHFLTSSSVTILGKIVTCSEQSNGLLDSLRILSQGQESRIELVLPHILDQLLITISSVFAAKQEVDLGAYRWHVWL